MTPGNFASRGFGPPRFRRKNFPNIVAQIPQFAVRQRNRHDGTEG
eukprot:CAMPEP_0201865564 /NCGR_PEP_ID=MMETSP0902-20130614/412_1 /ASSEMBLY_ACC=CAM_ASM_000551 /TAXON_ID=420261 /ORGANISM="Thalassiosira antarctica, Strain CCMP982" /LENGTH=44 /DNA_ID= /DNA_START= /DNA_END= /DNA_ORIENTATION=